jgi:hypothetical protein
MWSPIEILKNSDQEHKEGRHERRKKLVPLNGKLERRIKKTSKYYL